MRAGAWLLVQPDELPLDQLKAYLTVANPEFLSRQKMGLKTDGIERFSFLYEELPNGALLVPRGLGNKYSHLFKIEDHMGYGLQVDMKSKITLKEDAGQDEFVQKLRSAVQTSYGSVGQAAPGFGKTVCALEIAALLGVTTYVVVHKDFLMEQWRQRILEFYDIAPDEIGQCQQDVCDYAGKKVVLCMVHSLVAREYTAGFYSYPGLLIFDEVHRMAAPMFRKAITKFNARYRLGITATPKRKDGLEKVFFTHIGDVAAVGKARELKPRVQSLKTNIPRVPEKAFFDGRGKVSFTKVVSHLITITDRNMLIARLAIKAAAAGRKVFVFSDRREHLKMLDILVDRQMTVDGVRFTKGFYVGGMSDRQRTISATRDLILCTYAQAKEGLDIADADTMILGTPVKDVEQLFGRILREYSGKKDPTVIDLVDDSIPICKGMYMARQKEYRRLGYA